MLWTPRFVNYSSQDECIPDTSVEQPKQGNQRRKMASSSITNILPKMERLAGPYGMYATVYGLTKVVHVGHPVPAREILNGRGHAEDASDTIRGIGSRLWHRILKKSSQSFFGSEDATFEGKQSTKRPSSYTRATGSTKTPAYNHFKNFSGDGVFTADGSDWKAKRSSVLHCLLGNIHELESEVNESADELLGALRERSATAKAFNVVPLLQHCTIGLIYRVITHDHDAFGLKSNEVLHDKDSNVDGNQCTESETTPSPRSSATSLVSMEMPSETVLETKTGPNSAKSYHSIQAKQRRQSSPIKSLLPTYLESVTQIRMIILAQSRSIWYLLPRWMYHLISPMYREEERVMGPIREFARVTCQNAKKGSPLNLLSQRASHNNNQTMCRAGISKDMLDEAITLLFAGQDTSAATLSWTLHLLSLDPARQKKLTDEVRSVLRNNLHNSERDFVSKSLIAQMPYLDAVIKESMRLYPVAPFVVRKLTTNITIPRENSKASAKDTIIPSSTFACIWIYALHRNPKLWHSPEDFKPERWIDPQLRAKDPGQEEPGAYIPFAMGPRNCLGRPLAQIILRVLLARILYRYTVVEPRLEALEKSRNKNGDKIDSKCLRKDMQAGFTVLPSNGLMIKFVERDNNI